MDNEEHKRTEAFAVNRSTKTILPVLLLAACNSLPTGTIDDIEQAFLFEIEHVNRAWGLSWSGLAIDSAGNVYAYDHGHEEWDLVDNGSFTAAELRDKYEHDSHYLGRIDEDIIVDRFARIADVANEYSELEFPCADAGVINYKAFKYESTTGLYRPLLLRQEGDVFQENTSDAGRDLAEWLRDLSTSFDDAGIAPFTNGLCTP